MNKHETLLRLICKYSYAKGDFTLSSGKKSDTYINIRPVALSSYGSYLLGSELNILASTAGIINSIEAYAGVVLGGCPLAIAAASQNLLTTIFVRKSSKDHGVKSLVEVPYDLIGNSIALVEDVITSGTSVINAIKVLQQEGFCVKGVLAVIDRQEGGKRAIMDETSVPVYSLFTKEDLASYKGTTVL